MDDFNTTLQDFDFQSNNTNTSSRGTLTYFHIMMILEECTTFRIGEMIDQ
jgi:hypothetical protein